MKDQCVIWKETPLGALVAGCRERRVGVLFVNLPLRSPAVAGCCDAEFAAFCRRAYP